MLRAAVDAGADAVDADVRVTVDGELVAAHDDHLEATTNGRGSLASMTLAQLRALDAAWMWPGPSNDYPLRGKGVRIPTVEEILVAFPDRKISLEMKTTGGEQQLCDLLRRTGRIDDAHIGSAGDAAIDRFKPICPEATTTVTDAMVDVMQRVQASSEPWCAPVPIGQPPYRIGDRVIVTEESVNWNHEHGLAVYTWTIDDERTLREVKRFGVDGVYTGRVDIARRVFDEN